jgi:hypothetical protein
MTKYSEWAACSVLLEGGLSARGKGLLSILSQHRHLQALSLIVLTTHPNDYMRATGEIGVIGSARRNEWPTWGKILA